MAIDNDVLMWKNKLLDLSKKNNLINYKDTKLTTLEIVFPNFFDSFNRITSYQSTHIYNVADEDITDLFDDSAKIKTKEAFIQRHSKKMASSQVLLYNSTTTTRQVLRTLLHKSNESILERGVNVLYCAFGFLKWTDSLDSKMSYTSPILLIPVKLTNEAYNKPFFIEQIDDDIILNNSLKYMLKTNYGIDLPDYNDEPLEDYLNEIKSLIDDKWEVLNEARLATFSFNKLNMYLDIDSNKEKIKNNPIVKVLTNAEADEDFKKRYKKETIKEASKDLFIKQNNVVDADFSQSEAIDFALSGKSFVLQGPPGTGKSQTITNIIAELLYAGKKVLFVSEKMAALEIVYNNLKKVGLSEFALELHSFKANKKDFVSQIYDTLTLDKTILDDKSNLMYDEMENYASKLNEYDEAINKIYKPLNKTIYELLGLYNHYSNAYEIPYIFTSIKKYDEELLNKNTTILDKYYSFVKNMGFYKDSHLYGFNPKGSSYEDELAIKDLLNKAIKNNNNLINYVNKLNDLYGTKIESLSKLNTFIDFIGFVDKFKITNPNLLDINYDEELLSSLDSLEESANKIINRLTKTNNLFKPEIFDENLKELYNNYLLLGSSLFKRTFSSSFKIINKRIHSYLNKNIKVKYKDMAEYLIELSDIQKYVNEFDNNELKDSNLDIYKSYNTDFNELRNMLNKLIDYLKNNKEFKKINLEAKYDTKLIDKLQPSINSAERYVVKLEDYYDKNIRNFYTMKLSSRDEVLNNTLNNLKVMSMWIDYTNLIEEMNKNKLTEFVNLYVDKKYDLKLIKESYFKSFYRQLLDHIFKTDDKLSKYTRFYHDNDVRFFIKKDENCLDISRAKIRSKLSQERPDLNYQMAGSPANLIKREYKKTRKLMPIRKIFETIPEFIQKIKPCFLMSPLSVSTFLTDNVEFDVTIFDEASQVFPEDAIVAIYRSKQLIVVGDSKQMPPTKFFLSDDYEDEYDESTSDMDSFESILDLAETVFPEKSLLCHYRSKDESLITFSNKNFYNENLLSYPSPTSLNTDKGVEFIYVADGYMDNKTKVNLPEAKKVVELIFDHFKNHPSRSLGVVAFNIRQQEVIRRLWMIEREKNPDFEKYFSDEVKEPFFIKNLETVQGDERDTIIFSIAYAKDNKGVFAHRFGPLNEAGGERRLNVAITRAKMNVKVVSSIKAMDIDMERVTHDGPKLLHDYLDYAEFGSKALNKLDGKQSKETSFERDIYDFLISQGFEADLKVGTSKYKVDVAVKRPGTSDYVLAIECDGKSYHNVKSSRDRDRLRKSILERMNWDYYRIWSIDWFKDNEIEKKNLIEACKKALDKVNTESNNKTKDTNVSEKYVSKEKNKGSVEIYDEYKEYEHTNVFKNISDMVDEILKVEAPLSLEYLLKKYAERWYHQSSLTPRVYEDFKLSYKSKIGVKKFDGFLYTSDSMMLSMRKNVGTIFGDISYVSPYEIRNGMYAAIEYNGRCEKNDLYSFIRKQLGFAKAGSKINKYLDNAFELLQEYITIDEYGLIDINDSNKLYISRRNKA